MASAVLGSPLRSAIRLALYLGLTVPASLVQVVLLWLRLPARSKVPRWYHKQCCRIMGIDVRIRGRRSRSRPTLFVSNHVSYLDITVLGAIIEGSFIAKSEVEGWPMFGWLAKLQRTVFIERRIARTAQHRDTIARRLNAGDSLILFAEGTSGDGNRVLPFKSALLSVADSEHNGGPLPVQPVSIAYTKLDGLPLGRWLRPLCAWYGDMELASHLWQFAGLGRITVVVHFHPLVSFTDLGSRKALSDHCHAESQRGVAAALGGRPVSALAPKPDARAAGKAAVSAMSLVPTDAPTAVVAASPPPGPSRIIGL